MVRSAARTFAASILPVAVSLTSTAPRDRERDEWLKQRGVTVLRFWNSDVTGNLNGVLEVIAAKIEKLSSAPAPRLPNWRAERATDPHPASFARRPPPFR